MASQYGWQPKRRENGESNGCGSAKAKAQTESWPAQSIG
jgi:hypothetical protein